MSTKVTARSLSDIVPLLPFKFGYTVHRSIVLMTLKGHALGTSARFDLGLAREDIATVIAALERNEPALSGFIVIGFEDTDGESRPTAELVTQLLIESRPAAALFTARVHGDRCYENDDARGVEVPPASADAAEYVFAGVQPLPGRDAVSGLYAPRGGGDSGGSSEPPLTAAQAREALRVWSVIVSADVGSPPVSSLTPDEVVLAARLVAPVQGPEIRDALIAALCGMRSGAGDPGFVAQVRAAVGSPVLSAALVFRLAEVVRVMPRERCVPVLTIAAAAAWYAGFGTHAGVALGHALSLDPTYRLAVLLQACVRGGARPA